MTGRPITRPNLVGRGLTRRQFLVGSGLAATGLAVGFTGCAPGQATFTPAGTMPLPIPPLAPATISGGRRTVTLTAQRGESRLIAGRPEVRTPTMGYNGSILGPTVRAKRGEHLNVAIRNQLGEATSLHWHAMHLPAAMDGGPHTPIVADATSHVAWEIRQPAATLWYHPHPHGQTEAQVLNGLAGVFIIDDDASLASGLPQEYGVDDIPLVLQDRFLDQEGRSLRLDGDNALGTIGDTFLANGLSGAHFAVTTELVSLRLVNGCAARFLELHFTDERTFLLVGTDGGLLENPVELTQLPLSPGERAEILVRFRPGDRTFLRTERPVLVGVRASGAAIGYMNPGDFVEFSADSSLRPGAEWRLPADERSPLDIATTVRTRAMELRLPFLNGQLMDLARIDAQIRVGDTELWEVSTPDTFPHNFHIHDVQFRIVDINGTPPPAYLNGWKDTIPVFPGQTTRIIMRFEDYTDDRIPYMMHCHLLRHEDQGMMGQFLVTENGAGPTRIAGSVPGHSH